MVQIVSETDAVDFADVDLLPAETLNGSRLEAAGDQDASKPFRGILLGLVIVTPLWVAIGVLLYFVL